MFLPQITHKGKFARRIQDLDIIRVTSIKTLEQCPTLWAETYLNDHKSEDNKWSTIGTQVHSHVEKFLASVYGIDQEGDLINPICSVEEFESFDTTGTEVSDSEAYKADQYVKLLASLPIKRVIALEQTIEHQFLPGVPAIRGHMDCVVEMFDGTIAILDHKTNRTFQDVDWWKNEMQPILYATMLMEEVYPDIDSIDFYIGYVNLGTLVTWTITRDDTARLKARMAYNYGSMIYYEAHGWPMSVGEGCKYCPLVTTCPAYKEAGDALSLLFDKATENASDIITRLHITKTFLKYAEGVKDLLEMQLLSEFDENPNMSFPNGFSVNINTGVRRKVDASILREYVQELPDIEYDELMSVSVTKLDTHMRLLRKSNPQYLLPSIVESKTVKVPNSKPTITIKYTDKE